MKEIVLQCVSSTQDDPGEMLNDIVRLGKSIIDVFDFGTSILEPLSIRAYHASVYYFMDMLALLDNDVPSKYKGEILEDRWKAKQERSDNFSDLGVGEREEFIIGISEASVNSVCEDLFWYIKNEHESVLTTKDTNLDQYDKCPVLEIQKSYRAEFIEGVLRAKDMEISEIFEEISDLSALFDGKEIVDVYSLIAKTRENRNCGICEAVVESAFMILETWCKKGLS